MRSEIIAVGSEMLTPARQDTNSLYLTEKLNEIGVTVRFKTIVGDRRKDLVNTIQSALGRIDILILMGGLGPTEDDLTREAVAEALALTLRRDAQQVAALHSRAASFRITISENNLKQADILEGATTLPTPNGSAPGQWLETTYAGYRKIVMLLPGPPNECRPLFDEACLPRLTPIVPPRALAPRPPPAAPKGSRPLSDEACLPRLTQIVPPRAIARRTLRAAMIAESQADKLIAPIDRKSTRLNSSHLGISYAVFCLKK